MNTYYQITPTIYQRYKAIRLTNILKIFLNNLKRN